MRIYLFSNQKLKINIDGILVKNISIKNKFASILYKIIKSITNINSKIEEFKIYNKKIINSHL